MKRLYLLSFAILPIYLLAQKDAARDSLFKEAAKTEIWKPVPRSVSPAAAVGEAPADAVVLFNGKDLSAWEKKDGGLPGWKVADDGAMTVVKGSGDIATKARFGSCQLHIEWRSPAVVTGASQTRGNSGIFLMGKYELQVLDSYDNPTYVNGQAGSIYKQYIPLVNACRKPGEWQSYDLVFTAPEFDASGKLVLPAYITVLQNGILVQDHVAIKGNTEWIGQPAYQAIGKKEALVLQDHGLDGGNPVSFRNIWIRNL